MRIKNEMAKEVTMEYITETFGAFEFNVKNAISMIAAKMFVYNNFDKILPVVSQDGYIDIDAFESIAVPEIEKLGKFEMSGLGSKYSFSADDVKRLITKLKQRGEQ